MVTAAIEPVDANLLAPIGSGWQRYEAPTPLAVGSAFSAERVASGAGVLLVLCQAVAPGTLPARKLRMRLRRRIEERVGDVVVIFADAIRSAAVWSLPLGPGTTAAEYHLPGRESEVIAGLRTLLAGRAGPRLPALEEARLTTLISGRLPECPPGAVTLSELAMWVHRQAPPGRALRCWNALSRLTLLDPCCAEGEWLVAAGNTLLPLYTTVLHRLRADVDEVVAPSDPGRNALDAPRALLDAVRAGGSDAELYARRALCRQTLHGIAESPAEARAARGRLSSFGRLPAAAQTPFDLRVKVRRASACGVIVPPGAEREAWILKRARALLEPYRSTRPAFDPSFRRSALELERRERRWALRSHTPWADREGAFDLVRAG